MAEVVRVEYVLNDKMSRQLKQIERASTLAENSVGGLDDRIHKMSTSGDASRFSSTMNSNMTKVQRAVSDTTKSYSGLNTQLGNTYKGQDRFNSLMGNSTSSLRAMSKETSNWGKSLDSNSTKLQQAGRSGNAYSNTLEKLHDAEKKLHSASEDKTASIGRQGSGFRGALTHAGNYHGMLTKLGSAENAYSKALKEQHDYSFFEEGFVSGTKLFQTITKVAGVLPLVGVAAGGAAEAINGLAVGAIAAAGSLGRLGSVMAAMPGAFAAVGVGALGVKSILKSVIDPAIKNVPKLQAAQTAVTGSQTKIANAQQSLMAAQKGLNAANASLLANKSKWNMGGGTVTQYNAILKAQGQQAVKAGAVAKAQRGVATATASAASNAQKLKDLQNSTPAGAKQLADEVTKTKNAYMNMWASAGTGEKPIQVAIQALQLAQQLMKRFQGSATLLVDQLVRMSNVLMGIGRSPAFQNFVQKELTIAIGNLGKMFDIAIKFLPLFMSLFDVSQKWFSILLNLASSWGDVFTQTSNVNRVTQGMVGWIERGIQSIGNWVQIIINLGGTFSNIFGAAAGVTSSFEKSLVGVTRSWRDWTDRGSNVQKMHAFFDNTYTVLKGLGDLAMDVIKAFTIVSGIENTQTGANSAANVAQSMVGFMNQVGNGLMKFAQFASNAIAILGPKLEAHFTALGRIFGNGQTGNGLINTIGRLVDLSTRLVNGFANMEQQFPFLGKIVDFFLEMRITMFGLGVVTGHVGGIFARLSKGMGMLGLVTGGALGKVGGLVGALRQGLGMKTGVLGKALAQSVFIANTPLPVVIVGGIPEGGLGGGGGGGGLAGDAEKAAGRGKVGQAWDKVRGSAAFEGKYNPLRLIPKLGPKNGMTYDRNIMRMGVKGGYRLPNGRFASAADVAGTVGEDAAAGAGRFGALGSIGGKALGVGGKALGIAGIAYSAYQTQHILRGNGSLGHKALSVGTNVAAPIGGSILGGMAAGALAGGEAGTIGGPVGMIAGGIGGALAGPAAGYLGSKFYGRNNPKAIMSDKQDQAYQQVATMKQNATKSLGDIYKENISQLDLNTKNGQTIAKMTATNYGLSQAETKQYIDTVNQLQQAQRTQAALKELSTVKLTTAKQQDAALAALQKQGLSHKSAQHAVNTANVKQVNKAEGVQTVGGVTYELLKKGQKRYTPAQIAMMNKRSGGQLQIGKNDVQETAAQRAARIMKQNQQKAANALTPKSVIDQYKSVEDNLSKSSAEIKKNNFMDPNSNFQKAMQAGIPVLAKSMGSYNDTLNTQGALIATSTDTIGAQITQKTQKWVTANATALSALNAGSAAAPATAGPGSPPNTSKNGTGSGPLAFSKGGVVPGRGSKDTVHAVLTPGEVVLNKAQQANPFKAIEAMFGLKRTSGDTDAPGVHVPTSYHYRKAPWGGVEAYDYGNSVNSPATLAAAAKYAQANASKFAEEFYNITGGSVKDGKFYANNLDGAENASNHLHLAISGGGPMVGPTFAGGAGGMSGMGANPAFTKLPNYGNSNMGKAVQKMAAFNLANALGAGSGTGTGGGTAPTGNIQSIISWAAQQYGANAAGMARVAKAESGFNPNAINNYDINAKEGHPSQGLFQFIPTTFQSDMDGAIKANPSAWQGVSRAFMDPTAQSLAAAWAITNGRGGAWSTIANYGKGGAFRTKRPQLIQVGERGAEDVSITPVRGRNGRSAGGRGAGGIHHTSNFHIGTLVADDKGLEKLADKIGQIQVRDLRKARATTKRQDI